MARAAAARAAAPAPAPRHAPRRAPRRHTRTAPARPVRRRSQAQPAGRRAKAAARLAAIPRSPFVDRLLTGRVWIVLLAVLLAGIVTANVALLEMNAGIARTTEKVTTLKRQNSRLRLQAARLGSSERIQRAAADLGLVLPAPGEVRYLDARPDEDPAPALKRMSAPDPVPVYTPPPPPEPTTPVTTTTPPATAETAPPTTTTTTPAEPVAPEPAPAPTATATPPATTGQTG
jgi:cell division protein FtsL